MRDEPSRIRILGIRILGPLAAAAFAVSAAGAGVLGAATPAAAAASGPVPITLRYTCSFPIIGSQPMTASILWTDQNTHLVGQATAVTPVNASATVGPLVSQALGVLGATTIDGTADVSSVVTAPQGPIGVTVPLGVPVTAVPGSGPLSVDAHGNLPSMTFKQPGNATITVGEINLHFAPKTAGGGSTLLNEVNSTCELASGQSGLLANFQILTAPVSSTQPPAPATSTTSAPVSASAQPTAQSPSATAGASSGVSNITPGPATMTTEAPNFVSSSSAANSNADLSNQLLAVAAFLVAAAAIFGVTWWLRRRRAGGTADGNGP